MSESSRSEHLKGAGDKSRERLLVRGGLVAIVLVGIACGAYFLAVHVPTDDSFYPKCFLHSTTGLHCPGCGLTRSLHSALNGRFEQMLAYNIFSVLLLPLIAMGFFRVMRSFVFNNSKKPNLVSRVASRFAPALLVLMILFFILRNIPVYPLTLLAPHELTP